MFSKIKKVSLSNWLVAITAFYIAGSVLQNILAVKTFGSELIAITTGGTIISWLVFACMDVITEIWGKKKAIQTFVASAIFNLVFNGICWIAILLPGTSDFVQGAYSTVLGTGWRIAIASITAFLIGNYVNAQIMHVMRVRSKDETNSKGFMFRAILSTLLGQLVDNGLFYLLAFAPIGIVGTIESPWLLIGQLVLFTTCIETVVEAIVSPLTAKFVKHLRTKKEEK